MIELKKYQSEAVEGLLKDTYSLLKKPGGRLKMVFKAPTGAGKTVTMAAYLNKLCEELPDKLELPQRDAAFIWIAPNQLHLQSFNALKSYFSELRSIKPIQFEDITDGCLKPNEVLFLNWQSVNKEGNLYIKENESDKTLINYVNQAKLNDTEIIVILDEAHLFASRGRAAQDLLQKIYAKIEIDVSATPLYTSDYGYIIKRQEVVEAEMIKEGVSLNPALDAHMQHGKPLNQILLDMALKKREELLESYKKLGVNINPLLLIQLPNDTQSESSLDNEIKAEVIQYLQVKDITTQNNRLAVWLSNTKINLEGIESPDSMVDVLLFKQAIALGWDCPRAAVLLIFREIHQETFTIQTVGRILRMPEQKHYTDAILNYGYVYTNLSRNIIQIVQDDMDYIVQNKAIRIKDYKSIALKSYFINTGLIRNRLGSKFKTCLYKAAEEDWGVTREPDKTGGESLFIYNANKLQEKLIELNVSNIEIPIPRDVKIEIEVGSTQVNNLERFAKTKSELDILFRRFCRNHVGGFAKVDSTPVLEFALKSFFEDYVGIDEFQAVKMILLDSNNPRFIELIDRALQKQEELLKQKAASSSKTTEESEWDVPPERIYNENYSKKPAELHALEPFYEQNNASSPEKGFSIFLEKHREFIEWWYKNGDKNKEDFAVTYKDREGTTRGFYVDFVIKLKGGKICLFDTKTPNSDAEFCSKHNALIAYIRKENRNGKNLLGGIIVPKEENVWKFCDNPIISAHDITGWILFDPANIN
ncbi:MAG: DEAD/DEAH box helicase [Chitinophagaceae bacterium]|nr:MAG: DEAD/DEAH box helicase [Chitinophagaceae bacterium]